MGFDPNTSAAQVPTAAPKKNWLAIILSIVLAVVVIGVSVGFLAMKGGSANSTAIATQTTTEAPSSTVIVNPTYQAAAPAITPAVAVTPITTSPAVTNPTGILAKPTNKDAYEQWVPYLESVYSTAIRTQDSALLSKYFAPAGARYTPEFGANTGEGQDATGVAKYRMKNGRYPPVAVSNVSITLRDESGALFISQFTSTSEGFSGAVYKDTYIYDIADSSWKVQFQIQVS